MKRSPITPRQAAQRLKEIAEQKRAAKAARSAARRAKAAANPDKKRKAGPVTEHTPPKRRVRSVSYRILNECELGPSGLAIIGGSEATD